MRDTLITLGIALGLGLLVGLQRERKGDEIAGIRTFALITLLGAIAALAGHSLGTWVVPAGAVALGGLMAVGALLKARANVKDIGMTTEVAALVMYGLGAYLDGGDRTVAVVAGGAVALLLYWKAPLHGFVQKMGDTDVAAIMQFVLITLVILPILPNQKMGPFNVLNPFEIWLVVVLVVGMSLIGYVLHKFVPPTAGAFIGGAVGGLVSSTAVTVSYARKTCDDPHSAHLALQAICTANVVSALRVIVLLSLFAGDAVHAMIGPLALLTGCFAVIGALSFACGRGETSHIADHDNPAELKAAVIFGLLYATIRLVTAWARDQFGSSALFAVAGVSGLTDLDAITLSISDMARNQNVTTTLAWRVIIVATLANYVFKGGCVMVLGSTALRKWIFLFFSAAILAGVAIIFFYPTH